MVKAFENKAPQKEPFYDGKKRPRLDITDEDLTRMGDKDPTYHQDLGIQRGLF
jgi:hypothetical protein